MSRSCPRFYTPGLRWQPPVSRTTGIERSEFNRQGWYLYGKWIKGVFLVKALEPRIALRVAPTRAATKVTGVSSYLKEVHLSELQPDMMRAAHLDPRAVPNPGNSLARLRTAA